MNLPNVSNNLKTTKRFDVSKVFTYGVPAGAIGISLFILVFLVWPKLTEALAIRSSNTELTTRISALSAKIAILNSIDQSALSSQLGLSEAILPSDKFVFAFVRQIESLSSKNGVILNKVDVVPGFLNTGDIPEGAAPAVGATVLTNEPAPKIQIRIAVLCDYNSFINFLTSLYALPRVSGIKDLSVNNSGNSTGESATLSVSMVVDAYYKTLPSQLGSVESPVSNLMPEEVEILSRASVSPESSGSATPNANEVPLVPTGRSDLFAPF